MKEFIQFRNQLNKNLENIMAQGKNLYITDVDKDELWDLYLDSFPEGTNEIFRERRQYDCSCCRGFIKNIGAAVAVVDNKLVSIWDFTPVSDTFKPVAKALGEYVKSRPISELYLNDSKKVGNKSNTELLASGELLQWDHFYIDLLPKYYEEFTIDRYSRIATYRENRGVFRRGLETLTVEALETVLDLINDNNLYRGIENKQIVNKFYELKLKFDKLNTEEEKQIFVWDCDYPEPVLKIRNTSIGTLLIDLSEGRDLVNAVASYENKVSGVNYKRPKALYTKKMLEAAKKTIEDLGYLGSLKRRFAVKEDITVNDILFKSSTASNVVSDDLFDVLEKDIKVNPRKVKGAAELSIDAFLKHILPEANSLEMLVENRHVKQLMSLIAPADKTAPSMLKWNNGFSWTYNGNVADSDIKQNVKDAGGNIEGVMRFSIQWNDMGDKDNNDLDAHCYLPDGDHIFFSNKESWKYRGALDIDIVEPLRQVKGKPAVENIVFTSRNALETGDYKFFVNQFHYRGGDKGFRAEIEIDGETYKFDYPERVRGNVDVATVHYDKKTDKFTLIPYLESDSSISSKEEWGIKTNTYIPVDLMMLSPNYWEGETEVGAKHFFFILEGCENKDRINGFFNEYLSNELKEHRKVFEALGSKSIVEQSEGQLSGIGFNSTVRNDVIVRVDGNKLFKIQF